MFYLINMSQELPKKEIQPTDEPIEKKDEVMIGENEEEIIEGEIKYPFHWADDEGNDHGARTEKERQDQIDAYRESKRER